MAGIRGRRIRDQRLPPKERIVGVRINDAALALAEKDVRSARVVQADVGSMPIVVVAPRPDYPIVTFDRRVSGRVLSFRLAGVLSRDGALETTRGPA
jgi:hypothetical protein